MNAIIGTSDRPCWLTEACNFPLLFCVSDTTLLGGDKAKYDSLKACVHNEQQEFLKKLRSKAHADSTRYTGCLHQAAHQIEVGHSVVILTGSCQLNQAVFSYPQVNEFSSGFSCTQQCHVACILHIQDFPTNVSIAPCCLIIHKLGPTCIHLV